MENEENSSKFLDVIGRTFTTGFCYQAGNYLVFQGTGPMPMTVIETWTQVWAYFESNTEHQRNFISDFECYSGPDQMDIYIGLT